MAAFEYRNGIMQKRRVGARLGVIAGRVKKYNIKQYTALKICQVKVK